MSSARWIGLGILVLAVGCGGAAPSTGNGTGTGNNGSGNNGSGNNGSGNGTGNGNGNGTGTGGGAGGGSGDPANFPPSVFPDPSYTGFDGTHTFAVPVSTDLAGTITWTASDPTLATVTPIAADKVPPDQAAPGIQWAMVTAKKAGTVTITASAGGKTATAKVNIAAYTADQWTAGQTRWMTAPTGLIACTSCHTGTAAIDNTPTWEAEFTDAQVIGVFTLGQYPDGTPLHAPNHMFTLSDAEKNGLVAYLRSLPPKGF